MPAPDPNENATPQDTHGVNISGGENMIRGDVVGGDKIIQGDVNTATIGENARAGQVAVGDNITQTHIEQQVVVTEETAYDVRGCENPYLGLAAFKYADAKKYAGREKVIAETVAKITEPASPVALLFITGASGSGKSSFAQAGLLPALEKFYDGFTVKHAVMRPAGDPLAALNDALWRQLQLAIVPGVSVDANGLRPDGLFADTPPKQINLLVVDQFEEFFTQSPSTAREIFFAFLVNLPAFAQTRTHIIATMRADYLPELFNHPALYDIAKRGVDLRAINADELQDAIQQPLRASKYADTKKFEPSLVDKLAEDAAQDAAYLPLLQVSLEEIWRKGFLKSDAYKNLTDAIKQRADQVLEFRDFDDATPDEKRDDAEQAALLNLLLDLVDVSSDDDIHRDVRKQRAKTDLTRGDPQRERWLNQLSAARLLSVQQEGKDTNQIEVDLIHETLLTNWTRLQAAIAERRSELRHRARFEQNLDEWVTQNRSDDYLLEGVRLAEARELEAHGDVALQNEDAKAYVRASIFRVESKLEAELKREREYSEALEQARRAAEINATEARLAQKIAEDERERANAQRLAAQSVSKRGEDLSLSYLLGIEAFKKCYTFESLSNLFSLCHENQHRNCFLWGHKGAVWSIAFSRDGKTLAMASRDKTLFLWDVVTRKCIAKLEGHKDSARSVAFSPDGKMLASGSFDKRILLWDIETQKCTGELRRHSSDVNCIEFSPDGNTLVSGSGDKTILLWDLMTRQYIAEFKGHTDEIYSVTFSPDGTTIVSGGRDKTILLWDIATQQQIGEFKGHLDSVRSVAFSPDGKMLASGSWDKNILLWDVRTQQRIGEFKGHTDSVYSVAFSPDGKTLASGGRDRLIILWDVATAQRLDEFVGHTDTVRSLEFSSDGRLLVSGSDDKTILLWDIAIHQIASESIAYPNWVSSIAISTDGNTFALSTAESIVLWDVKSQAPLGGLKGPKSFVNALAFSPDGKTLASGGRDTKLLLWDIAAECCIGEFKGHTYHVESVAFSPDGKILAGGGGGRTVFLWDVVTQQLLGEFRGHTDWVTSIAFSPDAKTVASGSCSEHDVYDVCTSGELLIREIATRKQIGELRGQISMVKSLAFSPDGKMLASGGDDGLVFLWDMTAQQRVGSFKGPRAPTLSLAFSADGQTLISANQDKTILFWDINPASWLANACKIVNRNLTRAEYAQYISREPGAYDTVYTKNPTCPGLPVEPLPTPVPSPTP